MSKLFGGLKMGWPAVILFAVAAGVYTGAVNSVPALDNTSFIDIAVSFEWWIVFAVVIATNCGKPWESALKIFAFFVISQPLVFAVEVALRSIDAQMAWYYYATNWGPKTLLTLPGGFLAYYVKDRRLVGGLVMGLTVAAQVMLGVSYLAATLIAPPRHLLSAVFCFGSAVVMLLCAQKSRRNRVVALAVAAALFVAAGVWLQLSGRVLA